MTPAEKLETYRQNLRRGLSRQLTETELAHLNKARDEAAQLAQMLVHRQQAQQVWLVGSVARRRPLRPNSNIDLAVEGMPSKSYFFSN